MLRRHVFAVLGLGLALALVALALVVRGGAARAVDPAATDTRGARVVTLTIDSEAVGRRLPVRIVVPAGAAKGARRPLLVFLHGRGGNERSSLGEPLFAALERLGARAPIVAFPYGGDHSFWHDRRDGKWGRYVMREVIPQALARVRADRRRVAIGGISMGGFGAYDLARLHPRRFCAAGGHSPGLWRSAGETAPGAFDDAADFARHDVIAAARAGKFRKLPLWLDAGDQDPFLPGDDAFVSALRGAGGKITKRIFPGGHGDWYWAAHWDDYLRFYARVLGRCRG
jgi:S-formylglutathione hydrolase FrmB